MILYHTSTIEIRKPDILHSRSRLDFGIGFYLTPVKEQAVRYGERFTREQALDQLRYKKPNHQVCITSQRVLDKYLHFQSSQSL
ncbi:MAG: DUF3990 domain-containing protein [Bacteroidales bacterium]|nr:DUF3990 domain-containing protein [Bacteroidales bacterium]